MRVEGLKMGLNLRQELGVGEVETSVLGRKGLGILETKFRQTEETAIFSKTCCLVRGKIWILDAGNPGVLNGEEGRNQLLIF